MPPENIELRGVRTNNLKNIDIDIPLGKLTVVTGVSGSGKSSLAFNTLYAEGQRRFLESLTTYSRQFLRQQERPELDSVRNIPPAIAFEQKNMVTSSRSTVGTATEINDYLRLLYAVIGKTVCPDCKQEVQAHTPQSVYDELFSTLTDFQRPFGIIITFLLPNLDLANWNRVKEELINLGYYRLWVKGEIIDITNHPGYQGKAIEVLIDRITGGEHLEERLKDSLSTGFAIHLHSLSSLSQEQTAIKVYSANKLIGIYQTRFACSKCARVFSPPDQALFSFNNAYWACPTCSGFGKTIDLDISRVINPRAGLGFGAIVPWTTAAYSYMEKWMLDLCKERGIQTYIPYGKLSKEHRRFIEEGEKTLTPNLDPPLSSESESRWPGVKGFFANLSKQRYKVYVRVMLSKYRSFVTCPSCHGSRLKPEADWVTVCVRKIWELWDMAIPELLNYFIKIKLTNNESRKIWQLLEQIIYRLRLLDGIGLGYMSLGRPMRTLSGGEAQRINLASAIGGKLSNTLYVLDEPTIGLHARDVARMLVVLKELQNLKNTVVVVEHAPEIIREADLIIDLGPGAGESGGELLAVGDYAQLMKTENSITAQYLHQGLKVIKAEPLYWGREFLVIEKATCHNLKGITLKIPLHKLTCITGVSGSGKTTLLRDVIYNNYLVTIRNKINVSAGDCQSIRGFDKFNEVVFLDQSPLTRTSRSNPATITNAWGEIRECFANTKDARRDGRKSGYFSFNVTGGRCEKCLGVGKTCHDMQFLADVWLVCDVCEGKRFTADALKYRFKGYSVNRILNMTVDEAISFFAEVTKVVSRLRPLQEVGLGYLRIGQETSTLSGGESQRLKLAVMLAEQKKRRKYLVLMDEPTTGLHLADIEILLRVLGKLINEGHTVMVIEHNLDFIRFAEHIIDLGPDGGDRGGMVVAEGSLDTIIANRKSLTGRFLRRISKV